MNIPPSTHPSASQGPKKRPQLQIGSSASSSFASAAVPVRVASSAPVRSTPFFNPRLASTEWSPDAYTWINNPFLPTTHPAEVPVDRDQVLADAMFPLTIDADMVAGSADDLDHPQDEHQTWTRGVDAGAYGAPPLTPADWTPLATQPPLVLSHSFPGSQPPMQSLGNSVESTSSSLLMEMMYTGGAGEDEEDMTQGLGKHALLMEKQRRRRESHNAVERRRRDQINDRIQDLAQLVPDCGTNENGMKLNKGVILKKTTEYIRYLQHVHAQTVRQCQHYEQQLEQAGLTPQRLSLTQPPPPPATTQSQWSPLSPAGAPSC